MSHHFRSYSEQKSSSSFANNAGNEQPPIRLNQLHLRQQSINNNNLAHGINNNGNSNNNNNNSTNNNSSIAADQQNSSNGIIRIHSDSQQSLDRLFNPSISEASVVPLRQRKLPLSFFNPGSSHSTQEQQQQSPQQTPQRNYHYRNISSPAFMNNNASMQANQFYSPSSHNNYALGAHNVDTKPSSQTMYYAEVVTQDATMTDTSYHTQQAPLSQPTGYQQSHQSTVPHDFNFPSGSNPSLPSAVPINSCTSQQGSTYFASNEFTQQQFHISHSQPYIPYDPALSTSFGTLNVTPSQAASSSSSNENNSLLCIPTPAVHSRSCSFDDRPVHPVTHARSQSTVAAMTNTCTFRSSVFNNNPNYSGSVATIGIKSEQPAPPIRSLDGSYNQVALSPIADQAGVFDEWGDILS